MLRSEVALAPVLQALLLSKFSPSSAVAINSVLCAIFCRSIHSLLTIRSEHGRHHDDRSSGHDNTTASTTTTTTTTTGHHGLKSHGTAANDTSNLGSSTTGHHHGRDAALGAGAGAAGVGLAHRGRDDTTSSPSYDQSGTTTHDSTHGAPHEKEGLMAKLTSKLTGHKSADHETGTHGSTTDSSHTGRDAALVGGAGTAAYGAEKHHHGSSSATDPTTHGLGSGTSGNTYPTNTSTSRNVDPVGSEGGHHYGRDAAVAGGAVGLGGAAYGAGRHHDGTSSNVETYGSHSDNTFPAGTTTDPARSNVGENDRHYGRDAAIAGGAVGAGGVAYEADQHHKQKDLEKDLKKQHKHDEKDFEKDLKKEHKHEEKEHEKELKAQHKHDEKLHKEEVKQHEKDLKEHEKELKHQEKENKGGLLGLGSMILHTLYL
jgi:hypothetical protein